MEKNLQKQLVRVAIPGPFWQGLDYTALASVPLQVGQRVKVPLGKRQLVGVVSALLEHTPLNQERLKNITAVIDSVPLFSGVLLTLLRWVSLYYHHPLGDCFYTAMPKLLCEGATFAGGQQIFWRLTEAGKAVNLLALKRAQRQWQCLSLLHANPQGVEAAEFGLADIPHTTVRTLAAKGWCESYYTTVLPQCSVSVDTKLTLNVEQQAALDKIVLHQFGVYLLEGVTGSGKTEVYLQCIEQVLATGKQALVLVPEIALTPQTVERFRRRFMEPVIVLHSALTDAEKLQHWYWASTGEARIIIGTRSAVFVPCAQLGIIVVDEEHDMSFKQQNGLRYGAREVAIKRAQLSQIPILLGSATPSLETLYHATITRRYQSLTLTVRAGVARPPVFHVIDMRQQPLYQGLSRPLLAACEQHLAAGGQVLLFLNRRGYAPVLMCHHCGWTATCPRCERYYTVHRYPAQLLCHHCSSGKPLFHDCPACHQAEGVIQVGMGTERIEEALAQFFPEHKIIRIDRSVTQRKGQLAALLSEGHSGNADILVGTQMLAKGHHFAGVTMVGIIDVDAGLFSSDFRAIERTGQLIVQVAGRAGREARLGEVYIQTHQPQHRLLNTLLREGYSAFAQQLMRERQAAEFPPFGYLALVRAEALSKTEAQQFLNAIKLALNKNKLNGLSVLGPIPAVMAKKANYYRWQLLLQVTDRAVLHEALQHHIPSWLAGASRQVRWSIDVDPQELN